MWLPFLQGLAKMRGFEAVQKKIDSILNSAPHWTLGILSLSLWFFICPAFACNLWWGCQFQPGFSGELLGGGDTKSFFRAPPDTMSTMSATPLNRPKSPSHLSLYSFLLTHFPHELITIIRLRDSSLEEHHVLLFRSRCDELQAKTNKYFFFTNSSC